MATYNKVKSTLKWMVAILLVAAICFAFMRRNRIVEHQTIYDTIQYYDTIIVEKPVARDSVVLRYVTEVLPIDSIVYKDSLVIRDSVAVRIPITQKKYASEDYTAFVSGYKPSLDSLFIYKKERLVIERIKPRRWSIGIQGGYGITPKGMQPYIGVGISYRLFGK